VTKIAYFGPDPARPGRKKRYYESAESDDPRIAERALRRRLKEISGDQFVGPQREKVTISELLKEYRTDRELNGVKSANRFRSHLKRVESFFGHLRACEITTPALKAWVVARQADGYARATVQQWLALLRAAMRLPGKEGTPLRVPTFPHIDVDNARRGFFEATEVQAVIRALAEPWSDLVQFAYETGWRLGEILGLRWDMIDRRSGTITLPDSKSREPRVIPIEGELVGIIERRWGARVVGTAISPLVFHRKGRGIQSFRKRWAKACIAAGLYRLLQKSGKPVMEPTKTFHDLRRTFARDGREAGVSESVIMKRAGWKTRHVFERYSIVSVDDQRRAAQETRAYREAQLANEDRTRTIVRLSR
jgi:integrase